MVRGHQRVDLISLVNPKQTSSLVLPGVQMCPRCPQQPFSQGGTPAILCSSSQSFSQGQRRKAGDLQCPFPILLLGKAAPSFSSCPGSSGFTSKTASWFNLWSSL